jgi:hypothetical protein
MPKVEGIFLPPSQKVKGIKTLQIQTLKPNPFPRRLSELGLLN